MDRITVSQKAGLLTFVALFLICTFSVAAPLAPETKEAAFSSVFLSDGRLDRLKQDVAGKIEPAWSGFKACQKRADRSLDRVPTTPENWYVPGYYVDAEGHNKAKNGLRDDANTAYALALCYRMTGKREYADSAMRLINAWATGVKTMSMKDDSTLSFSYHFPSMIFAADLIRDEGIWPEAEQKAFSEFVRSKALPMNTMDRSNNWGNWGLVLASACAVYLDDEALFDQCVEKWKYFIEEQIAEDGHLPHEVNRSEGRRGIWYSHFTLMPQTIAAEILRVNGADLYDFTTTDGRNLELAYRKLAGWNRSPADFPYWKGDPGELTGLTYYSYFEILNSHWPDENATELIKLRRPMSAAHSAPFLSFTHGEAFKKAS